ncbi:GrpB family protein [Nocardia sp. NBC_00565]|uniref:GrpB family protein n=1 Tax=Nocardia sp. NBC_00565 TaxID=2975993 RepID=UPI002E8070C5|nr:GrpB family protein [Nocardia sp. NBC_00565]WUC07976.1 GrpB family protein [Nocardia sp. NBC_00565]
MIVDYDAYWPARAERLLQIVRSALLKLDNSDMFIYEHIGSTAVPGLAAKPILDLQVSMPTLPPLEAIADLLAQTGFEPAPGARADSPGVYRDIPRPDHSARAELHEKRLFRSPEQAAILHIRRVDSPFAEFVVLVRDWLRAHPDEARRYAAHKRALAAHHAADPDYDDYTRVIWGRQPVVLVAALWRCEVCEFGSPNGVSAARPTISRPADAGSRVCCTAGLAGSHIQLSRILEPRPADPRALRKWCAARPRHGGDQPYVFPGGLLSTSAM